MGTHCGQTVSVVDGDVTLVGLTDCHVLFV